MLQDRLAIDRVDQQPEFLLYGASDETEEKLVGATEINGEGLLHGHLVVERLPESLCRWLESVLEAVQYTDEATLPADAPGDLMESFGPLEVSALILWCCDFGRIGWADRRNDIGEFDGKAQWIHAFPVGSRVGEHPCCCVVPEEWVDVPASDERFPDVTLVADVVDREDAPLWQSLHFHPSE